MPSCDAPMRHSGDLCSCVLEAGHDGKHQCKHGIEEKTPEWIEDEDENAS